MGTDPPFEFIGISRLELSAELERRLLKIEWALWANAPMLRMGRIGKPSVSFQFLAGGST
jgi:hypothetical protein